jgi:tRNA(adenine34) deaminase
VFSDEYWMRQALQLADRAQQQAEVPVGAVLVRNEEIIAVGHNSPVSMQDPTAHAEIITMRNAAHKLGNYRLVDTTLYVTLEPCLMCAGAMIHARIRRLVFGAFDQKAGAVVSSVKTLDHSFINHHIAYTGGILAQECGEYLSQFFQKRRK